MENTAGTKVRSFSYQGQTFDIPANEVQNFLKDAPEASEIRSFTVGKDTFDIPVPEVPNFLKDLPDAKPLHDYDNTDYGPFDKETVNKYPQAKQNFERWQQENNGILQENAKPSPSQHQNTVNIPLDTNSYRNYSPAQAKEFAENNKNRVAPKTGYENFGSELLKRGQRSGWELNNMLAYTPDFVNRVLVEAYNQSPVGKGVYGIGKVAEGLGLIKTAEDWKMKAADLRSEKANEYINQQKQILTKEIAKINPKHEMGIVEAAKQGDWTTFTRNLAGGVADSFAPSLAMMLTGGTMGTTGMIGSSAAVFGAGKYAEMDQQAPDMDESTKVIAAATNGALEGIFETYLGSGAVGSAISQVVRNQGRKAAEDIVRNGVRQSIIDLVIKHPALAPLGESAEEMGTQISQNFVDKVSGYKPETKLFDGVIDAGLIGALSGAVHSAPLYIAKAATDNSTLEQPQQPTQQTPTTPGNTLTVDPNQQFEAMKAQAMQQAEADVRSKLHSSGQVVTVFDREGNPYQVADGDLNTTAGQIIVYEPQTDQSGNVTGYKKVPMSVNDLMRDEKTAKIVSQTETPEKVLNDISATLDLEAQKAKVTPRVGEYFDYNGEQVLVTGDTGPTLIVANQTGETQEVPKQVIQRMEMEKQKQAKAVSDNLLINKPENAVVPPVEDNTLTENAPKERKIIPQPIGNQTIDFAQNEDGSFDVVPNEKMTFEKAIPALEKKFKDHPKYQVQVDKVETEVPGRVIKGETIFDDDIVEPPTKKVVIQGVRIVPKAASQPKIENNETVKPKETPQVGNQIENTQQTGAAVSDAIPAPEVQTTGVSSVQPELEAKKADIKVGDTVKDNDGNIFEVVELTTSRKGTKQAYVKVPNRTIEEITESARIAVFNRNQNSIVYKSPTDPKFLKDQSVAISQQISDEFSAENSTSRSISIDLSELKPVEQLNTSSNENTEEKAGKETGQEELLNAAKQPEKPSEKKEAVSASTPELTPEEIKKRQQAQKNAGKRLTPEETKARKEQKAKALAIDPVSIEQAVLQFLVKGNRLNWDEIKKELFPRSETELKKRIWLLKKDAETIDNLRGILNGLSFEEQGNEANVFRNAVLDAVLRHGTPQSMVERILEIGNQNEGADRNEEAEFYEAIYRQQQIEEQAEREALWESVVDNNISEDEFIELYLDYYEQTENTTDEGEVSADNQGAGSGNRKIGTGNNQGNAISDRPEIPEKGTEVNPVSVNSENKNPEIVDQNKGQNADNQQGQPEGSSQKNELDNANQPAIDKLKSDITSLQKQIKIKQKEINDNNGVFGDTSTLGGTFGAQPFDMNNAKKVIEGLKAEISRKEKEIETLSKAGETGVKEAKGQQELVIPEQRIPEAGKTKEYEYNLRSRPFSIGTYPTENFIRFEEDGSTFGKVIYSKEIPFETVEKFELVPIGAVEPGDYTVRMGNNKYPIKVTVQKSPKGVEVINIYNEEKKFNRNYSVMDFLRNVDTGVFEKTEAVSSEKVPDNKQESKQKEPWQMTSEEFLAHNNKIEREFQKERANIVDEAQAALYKENPSAARVTTRDRIVDNITKSGNELYKPFREKWDEVQKRQSEFFGNNYENIDHEKVVKKAISKGKEIPANVKAEYPELKNNAKFVSNDNENKIPEQSTPSSQRSQNEVNSKVAEISDVLRGKTEVSGGTLRGAQSGKSEQENQLKDFAEQNGIWLSEDKIKELTAEKLPSGKEADVYFDKSGNNVIKVVNYQKYSKTPLEFLENRIQAFNQLFPETGYEIIGFTETDKGFSFVVSQPFVRGKLLSRLAISEKTLDEQQARVAAYMKDNFVMEPAGLDAFENSDYKVSDLHLKNVIEGEDGNLYVIDAITADKNAVKQSIPLLNNLKEAEKRVEEKAVNKEKKDDPGIVEIPEKTGKLREDVIAYFGEEAIDFTKSSISLEKIVLKNGDIYYLTNRVKWENNQENAKYQLEKPEVQSPEKEVKKRNIWIPKMTKSKLESLLAKPIDQLTENDKDDLLDFKYFIQNEQQSAFEKGLMDVYVSDNGDIYVPKNKFWVTNIDNATKGFKSKYDLSEKGEKQKPVEKIEESFDPKPEDVSFERARRAHMAISFDPEKRAKEIQDSYVKDMEDAKAKFYEAAKSDAQKEIAEAELKKYQEQYLKYLYAWIDAKGRTMSSMITGPARFPTDKNRKALEVESKRLNEFLEWDSKFIKAAISRIKSAATEQEKSDTAWESIKKNITGSAATIIAIDKGENTFSTRSLFVNSITGLINRMFKNGQYNHVIKALDYISELNKKYDKPIISDRSSIWELRSKAEVEINKEPQEQSDQDNTEEIIYEADGITITNNKEIERVQIVTPLKPLQDVINKLKASGWNWSPSNKAWQRKNTQEGIRVAIKFGEENYPKGVGGIEFSVSTKKELPETIKDYTGKERPTRNSEGRFIHSTEEGIRNFWDWFGNSKAVDEQGRPVVVYSGHSNTGMFGNKFMHKKATSGGFYVSESPDVASGYALGKVGIKESYENGEQYRFADKKGNFTKKIWQIELTDEQKQKIDELSEQTDEYGEPILGIHYMKEWARSNYRYDQLARRIVSNPYNLRNIWEFNEQMGHNIAYDKQKQHPDQPGFELQQKNETEQLFDELGIKWNSFDWQSPGVFPLYVRIQKPLDADKEFPKDVLEALKKAAKKERTQPNETAWGNDDRAWTKDYPLKQFVADIESGDEYWTTQVPKKALEIFRQFGYDGYKERQQKGSTKDRKERGVNWVAFDAWQLKSAIANKGTFDTENDDLVFSQMSFPRSRFLTDNLKSRNTRKEIVDVLNDLQSRAAGANDLVLANNFNDMLNKFAENGANDSKVEFVRQKGGRANGFYDIQGKTVYINLEKINSKDEALAVWVHENGWHNGVRNIVPEAELDKLFEKIYDSFIEFGKKDPKIAEIVYHVMTNYVGTTKATKGNEMAAKLAEKITTEEDLTPVEKGFWQQVMDWVRQMLRKWMKFDSGLLTEKQLAQLIKSAVQSNFQGPDNATKRKNIRLSEYEKYESNISEASEAEQYRNRLRNRGSIQDKEVKNWDETRREQFPRYEEITKNLLDKYFNKKQYLTSQEVEDIAFMYFEFASLKHQGSDSFGEYDLQAMRSVMNQFSQFNKSYPELQDEHNLLKRTGYFPVDLKPEFAFLGETGAANLDKAEEATTRLDNLKVAREMEQAGKTDIKNIDSEINELMKSLEKKYPVDLWFAYKKYSNAIVLSNIQVDKKERNKGIGTTIMNEIITLADKYGVAIGLTPTNDFGGNVARLKQFYRSFDFVPYKGYEMRESFIRKAKPVKTFTPQQIKLATGWERGAENSLFAGRTTQEVLDYLESYNIIKKVPC